MALNEVSAPPSVADRTPTLDYTRAMERLVAAVQALSDARTLDAIMEIVRHAARDLTGADGATFVLRDGDQCHYADENAIAPLWKGRRFPMKICISGWSMIHREPAVIEDIYSDDRIPAEAYRPTFVKSLAMVPIRVEDPIGAIGNYWAHRHRPTAEEVALLQMLANFTATALSNVDLYTRLEDKVRALEVSNFELDAFAWAASHDLRAPLRAIDYLSTRAAKDIADGDNAAALARLDTLRQRTRRMSTLLASMQDYARAGAEPDGSDIEMADGGTIIEDLHLLCDLPAGFRLDIGDGFADIRLPRVPAQRVFGNLVDNAVRHHDRDGGTITIALGETDRDHVFTVSDDGPGIPEKYTDKAFAIFQTLRPRDESEGSGMGLALVRKTLAALGGNIQLAPAAEDGRGATFTITWPKPLGFDEETGPHA